MGAEREGPRERLSCRFLVAGGEIPSTVAAVHENQSPIYRKKS